MMNTQALCSRTGIRLAIGLGAAVPLLLFGSGIASAQQATLTAEGAGAMELTIWGLAGNNKDNCSIWIDRDPSTGSPTANAPSDKNGIIDLHHLYRDPPTKDHTVWIQCYHAGSQTAFWNDQQTLAGGEGAAPAAPPAPPASAQGQLNGTYTVTSTTGGYGPSTWTITPCGDGCAHVVSSTGWSGNFSLANGQWTATLDRKDAYTCPDGSVHPGTQHFSIDAGTLTGTVFTSADRGECGSGTGYGETHPISITLTKTG
jgi:hypothetical protein